MDEVIRIKNLSKVYNLYDKPIDRMKEALSISKKSFHRKFYALRSISFDVKKGETVGIIGTNGSGKSTLLKIITNVLQPTEGEIDVQGKISALLELGAGFNPEYTGIENIYLNGMMIGYTQSEMEQKIENIIHFAEIGDFINQPVKMYSSGMFARLAFAVAINVEPDILIVDEALSVGDVFFQNKCFRKFDELREKGVTILFVSHDLSSIKQMCTRVLWIDKGKQMMFGDCMEVCKEYFNAQCEKQNAFNEELGLMAQNEALAIESNVKEKLYIPRIHMHSNNILSDKAEIISLYVEDSNHTMVSHLECGRQYKVTAVCKFEENFDDLILGILFENVKGLYVFAENTYAHNFEKKNFSARKGDVIRIDFTFVLPLIESGRYLITAALSSGTQENHVVHTWIHGAIEVDVERKGYNLALVSTDFEIGMEKIGEYSFI